VRPYHLPQERVLCSLGGGSHPLTVVKSMRTKGQTQEPTTGGFPSLRFEGVPWGDVMLGIGGTQTHS